MQSFSGVRQGRFGLIFVLLATLTSVPAGGWGQRTEAGSPNDPNLTQAAPLDINTASAAELRALPGMGDAYVKRVIDGRPYTAKNQIVTRGILPQVVYDKIRDRIVAHRIRGSE